MDTPRIAKPIVSENSAQPAQPVHISVEPAKEVSTEPTDEQAPIDPNSPEERQELIPQENWQTSPLFYELANFLGVDSRDFDSSAEQISVITDWAIQQSGSNKVEDIMHTIRALEEKLQPAPWGEKRASHIYRALRMESRYEAAKKAMGAFTKTGKWD